MMSIGHRNASCPASVQIGMLQSGHRQTHTSRPGTSPRNLVSKSVVAFREVGSEKASQAPAPKLPDVQRQMTRLPVKTIIEPFRIKASGPVCELSESTLAHGVTTRWICTR